MSFKQSFGRALKKARTAKGITQEDFSDVSSRTYLSTLERGLKSPTLDKLDAVAKVLGMHPLSLLTLACLEADSSLSLEQLFSRIRSELPE